MLQIQEEADQNHVAHTERTRSILNTATKTTKMPKNSLQTFEGMELNLSGRIGWRKITAQQ